MDSGSEVDGIPVARPLFILTVSLRTTADLPQKSFSLWSKELYSLAAFTAARGGRRAHAPPSHYCLYPSRIDHPTQRVWGARDGWYGGREGERKSAQEEMEGQAQGREGDYGISPLPPLHCLQRLPHTQPPRRLRRPRQPRLPQHPPRRPRAGRRRPLGEAPPAPAHLRVPARMSGRMWGRMAPHPMTLKAQRGGAPASCGRVSLHGEGERAGAIVPASLLPPKRASLRRKKPRLRPCLHTCGFRSGKPGRFQPRCLLPYGRFLAALSFPPSRKNITPPPPSSPRPLPSLSTWPSRGAAGGPAGTAAPPAPGTPANNTQPQPPR